MSAGTPWDAQPVSEDYDKTIEVLLGTQRVRRRRSLPALDYVMTRSPSWFALCGDFVVVEGAPWGEESRAAALDQGRAFGAWQCVTRG
jgi:hypothetical protein